MKILLSLLFISSVLLAETVIDDAGNVLIDGAGAGAITTAATAKDTNLNELQLAINARLNKARTDVASAQAAQAAAEAKATQFASFLAKTKEAVNAGDFDAAKALLNPEISKAEQDEKEKRKSELDEQIVKLQAERAKLDDAAKAEALKAVKKK